MICTDAQGFSRGLAVLSNVVFRKDMFCDGVVTVDSAQLPSVEEVCG